MPNVLAHFAVQGPATHGLIRKADPSWVLLGCVLPDIPWIVQRAARFSGLAVDVYDLRLYVAVQASLLFCLILSAAIASIASNPRRVFAILVLASALHLLLDALQTKWANGVHLLAPFSWHLTNWGLFWPESLVSDVLTAAGVIYAVWAWRRIASTKPSTLFATSPRRRAVSFGLLATYAIVPLAFVPRAEVANNHYVETLRDRDARTGRYVEFDRNRYLRRDGEDRLLTFAGEELRINGTVLGEPGPVSVRGRFVDSETVEVIDIHHHRTGLRDLASYTGLLFIAGAWLFSWGRLATVSR